MATAAGTTAGASSALSLSDFHKRWLVFGIALNKILVPSLRPYVEQGVIHAYGNVTASHNIHTQNTSGRLKKWPRFLNYENINGNDAQPRLHGGRFNYALFDCRVTLHVDFAKLYLQTHMAKFSAFDERCDASALLVLLRVVPGFSVAVQAAADDVRDRRNAWAHCDFSDWDAVAFQESFQMMEQLVKALGLPSADEGRLLSELKTWETTGTTLCMNSPVDPDLLHLIQHHVNTLQGDLCNLTFELEKQRDTVRKALQESATKLQKLETRVSKVETKVSKVETRVSKVETDQEDLKLKQMYMKQEIMYIQNRFARDEEKQSRDAEAVGESDALDDVEPHGLSDGSHRRRTFSSESDTNYTRAYQAGTQTPVIMNGHGSARPDVGKSRYLHGYSSLDRMFRRTSTSGVGDQRRRVGSLGDESDDSDDVKPHSLFDESHRRRTFGSESSTSSVVSCDNEFAVADGRKPRADVHLPLLRDRTQQDGRTGSRRRRPRSYDGAVGSNADVYRRTDRVNTAPESCFGDAADFDCSLPLLTTSAPALSKVELFTKPFKPSSTKDIQIGMNVLVNRPRERIGSGVVKYVGPLPGRKNTYIGVELRSGQEGKHDGSLDGKRFFHCEPNRGIFVSFHKVIMCYG